MSAQNIFNYDRLLQSFAKCSNKLACCDQAVWENEDLLGTGARSHHRTIRTFTTPTQSLRKSRSPVILPAA
ncbi:MAG: hypothetical protein GDA56_13635 [Hormoscilla sp. GM7CHS1pb]|nr:hypothetical protein [Hormoscilla sp. GM7CHS1pb]